MEHIAPWLIPLAISGGVSLACAIIAKIMPRKKAEDIAGNWGDKSAVAVEVVLLRYLPTKAEEEVEEGILCTIAYAIISFCQKFIARIKANNVRK